MSTSVKTCLLMLLLDTLLPACGTAPSDAGLDADADLDAELDADDLDAEADADHDVEADLEADADADEGPAPLPECRPLPWTPPPACGEGSTGWSSLIPGPGQPGHDEALALRADRFDRQFHLLNALGTGVNADASVPLEMAEERLLIERFLRESASWDFEAFAGRPAEEAIGSWHKVAGAYAGVGLAADAFRYAVLRDGGAPCEDLERARAHLAAGLEALHLAVAITGVPGVIARGFARNDLPGHGQGIEPLPLFDGEGNPLPEEKNNGTWREDNSPEGLYSEYWWEDSCSRDQLVGWVLGFGGAWEAIGQDPTFDDRVKSRLRADAAAIARSLMLVGDQGYDLEIRDADGRVAYHGYLNEQALDRFYLPRSLNAANALMALGIIATFAWITDDEELRRYLYDELIEARRLHEVSRDYMVLFDVGTQANFSGYNMTFAGGWLAARYLCDDEALEVVRQALGRGLYDRPAQPRQPAEQRQTFYDFVYAVSTAGATAWDDLGPLVDEDAIDRGLTTLEEFWEPPFWAVARLNCDEAEITSGDCLGLDGTPITVLGYVGRNDSLVAAEPLPMRLRPASNYYWRSNPYEINGEGDGSGLYAGVDFRLAYWMGRSIRRTP